jgi:hypothetical protein
LILKMTTNRTYAENKTLEETAHDIGVAVGKGAEKACMTVRAFGDGVKKGMSENKSLEKVEDAGEAVIKGVKEGAEKVGKAAGAFGDGIQKGIDDSKPLDEKMREAGEAIGKSVAEGVDNLKNGVEAELEKSRISKNP